MQWLEPISAVATVFLLLGATLYVLKRKGLLQMGIAVPFRTQSRRMSVVERLPLSPQHSLHLVRIGGELFLVGVSPQGCSLIDHPGITPQALEIDPSLMGRAV